MIVVRVVPLNQLVTLGKDAVLQLGLNVHAIPPCKQKSRARLGISTERNLVKVSCHLVGAALNQHPQCRSRGR